MNRRGLTNMVRGLVSVIAYALVWCGTIGLLAVTQFVGDVPTQAGYSFWLARGWKLAGWTTLGEALRLNALEHIGSLICCAVWVLLGVGGPRRVLALSIIAVGVLAPFALGGLLLLPITIVDLVASRPVDSESVWEADLALAGLGLAWLVATSSIVAAIREHGRRFAVVKADGPHD
jgi:Mn2+/Fe2+ NRAMP family transporter